MALRYVGREWYVGWTVLSFLLVASFVAVLLFSQRSLPGADYVNDTLAAVGYTLTFSWYLSGTTILLAAVAYFIRANPKQATFFPWVVRMLQAVYTAAAFAAAVIFVIMATVNCTSEHNLTACNGVDDDSLRWQHVFSLVFAIAIAVLMLCVTVVMFFRPDAPPARGASSAPVAPPAASQPKKQG